MQNPQSGIVHRRLLELAQDRLTEEPVLLLQGPRTVGKSHLLAELAAASGAQVLDLDDLDTREFVAADPTRFMGGSGPVCVDEYQHVPEVLDAIKAELNRDLRPGRFVLTGSTRFDALTVTQALTGRLHRMEVLPFSQGELAGVKENLLTRLLTQPRNVTDAPPSSSTRDEYIHRIVRGGFPLVLARKTEGARHRWIDDYVRLTVEHDIRGLSKVRQGAILPRLLVRLAAQTAQVLNIAKAAQTLGLDESTADSYARLLEAVFLIHRLPAWGTRLMVRATRSPKVHLVDSAIAARLSRLTPKRLGSRDPSAMTEFGHLLETFLVGELRKQASWLDGIAAVGHWRTSSGDEVDLIVERDDGGVIAFEIKASGRVRDQDLRSLRKLRTHLGERFLAGAALYLGARSYTPEDRLHVLPADRIWTT